MPKKSKQKIRNKSEKLSGAMNRPPMERMWRIHQEVVGGKYPNCRSLAEMLEVTSKTVQRDIEFMRDRLELPLAYEAVRHGYYYTGEVRDFPTMKITQGEVAALLLAQKSLEQFRGTSFEKPLAGAFRKLSQSLGSEMEVAWHELGQAMTVHHSGAAMADVKVFDVASKAVMGGEEIAFSYHKLSDEKAERRVVRPYHLGCLESQWYLFAHDTMRGAIRTFALPRIREVELTGKTFKRPKNFSLAKILEGSFAVFEGRHTKKVMVRFTGVAERLVGERMWHSSQKFSKDAKGLILTMEVGLSPDLLQWVLGWGAEAEVLSPQELRVEVAEVTKRLRKIYEESDKL